MEILNYKIVFLSNSYNHHQSALSEAFYRETGGEYVFIETEPMEEERKNMGWSYINLPSFVLQSYISNEKMLQCRKICNEADVVIIGNAPDLFIVERIN